MLSLERTRTIYVNGLCRDYNKFHLSNNFKKDKTNLHDKSKSLDRKNKDSFVSNTAVKRLPKITWLPSFSDKNQICWNKMFCRIYIDIKNFNSHIEVNNSNIYRSINKVIITLSLRLFRYVFPHIIFYLFFTNNSVTEYCNIFFA